MRAPSVALGVFSRCQEARPLAQGTHLAKPPSLHLQVRNVKFRAYFLPKSPSRLFCGCERPYL